MKTLGISVEELTDVLTKKNSFYSSRSLIKKNGSRTLQCIKPNSRLYVLQNNLVNRIFEDLALPDTVYGFVRGRSYKDFLNPHVKVHKESTRYYLRLDIKDFFESITQDILEQELMFIIKVNENAAKQEIMSSIINIVTLNGSLPQGAVTSPIISNIIFRRADIRINNYCKKHSVIYTRYADDLLFSTENMRIFNNQNIKFFIKMITNILKSLNLRINRSKIKKGENKISLNGFVIDNEVRISRKKKQDITKVLFLYENRGVPSNINQYLQRLNNANLYYRNKPFNTKQQLINYLAGYRSFLIDWCSDQHPIFTKKNSQLIKRVEKLIIDVEALS
ncbi:reverse transcriptase family protein [Paenibacillus lautus]|uniref:reverse transcriptase family protein n=1 Tax=Paenibacillus lautus TaxID=1401 RepID=UPI002DB6FA9B|nr:reverse transcriptase family protein [Paenibacillus lautus]MEC0259734.1 reverse transcriptase family protein [Paenibacillus lautus]